VSRVSLGPVPLGDGAPLVLIAGPCVIESESHALDIARELVRITAASGVPLIFKASFDKANRTSVESYRGPGLVPGLRVLEKVKEETGLDVEPTGIVGVYSDPNHVIEFSDGEVRQQFSVCFTARLLGGAPATSDESTAVRFVAPAELDDLAMHPAQRLRIRHFLECRPAPFFS